MKNRNTITICTTILLACFGFLPGAQPVVPAPDGGYPGFNTAEGENALFSLTTGSANTAVGWHSLFSNTEGSFNTATGAGTLLFNAADANTAFGTAALLFNTTGNNNTAVGATALLSNTEGSENTANGAYALYSNTTGGNNTATGANALLRNTTGSLNTAMGVDALRNNTIGQNNTALGAEAGANVTTATGVIALGSRGLNVANSCFIGHIRGVTTGYNDAIPVFIDSAGQLGTVSSSRRFKTDIQPMDTASEAILALKPVSFHYKSHKDGPPQFGLIAEEVAEVNPDLVVRDEKGDIYAVRYDAVNAMLLNEFLKEHRRVEERQATIGQLKSNGAKQEATISELKRDLGILTTQLKEQAAQIQKVSAQVEVSGLAPRSVVSNHQIPQPANVKSNHQN